MAKREDFITNKRRNFENNISDLITNIVSPIFDKNDKLETKLILNWVKIFPSEIAKKVTFKKLVSLNKKENKFALHIEVLPQNFLELSYSKENLCEAINTYFGFKMVESIVLHQKF